MRFTEALCLHTEHLKFLNMSERTIGNYHSGLQAYGRFLELIGLDDVTEATPAIFERYRSYLFESKGKHGEPLSIGTQIQALCAVNRLYATLVEKGVVLVNVAEKLPMPKEPQRLPKRLPSVKEVERMLAKMPTKTPLQFRDRVALEVFYACGIRQAELSGLRTSDADLKRQELYVIGKGLKDRTLPLTNRCADCLGEYVPKVRPLLPPSPILFPSKSGSRLEARSLIDMASVAAKAAGIRLAVTTHTFRHVLATELLRNGANLREIQEYLGHRSIETTTIYAHVLGKDLKRVHQQTHPREKENGDGN